MRLCRLPEATDFIVGENAIPRPLRWFGAGHSPDYRAAEGVAPGGVPVQNFAQIGQRAISHYRPAGILDLVEQAHDVAAPNIINGARSK